MRNAQRVTLPTNCDPVTGEPQIPRAALNRQLKFIQVNATLAGDNIVIPPLAGIKQIFEIVLWNVAAQTLRLTQGAANSANGLTLLQLTNFPALAGLTLGFNGSFDQPHWELDNGQPLVLNLGGGTQVDGFVRYRVKNGTA